MTQALNDDTKILTETDTKTFFTIPNFPKPKPRIFSETKFSETESKIFFRDQIVSKPKPRLFSETETLKDLAKVSKPRSFETEMSISGHMTNQLI